MKIGLVTTSFPREPGDPAGSFVGAHARWLRRAGHEVDIVCAGEASGKAGGNSHELPGTNVIRVASRLFYRGGAPESLASGGALATLAAAGFSLRQVAAVRRRMPSWDAVCAHWLAPSAIGVAALLGSRVPGFRPRFASQRRSIPFLAIAHSGDVHVLSKMRLSATAARWLLRARARIAFSSGPLAQSFLANAAGSQRALTEQSVVCPMGVEEGLLGLAGYARTDDDRVRLLFLGRLVAIKGVDVLLDAFAELPRRSSLELIIAGDGPERGALEARAERLGLSDTVRFVGEVRGAGRDHFLANSDLMVVPSRELEDGRTEGMPVVVLEAIAAGTPVIVSATGGMVELPDSVPRVRPGSATELAKTIAANLHRDRRRILIERQRPIAEAQRWDRVGTILWRHWMQTAG